MTLESHSQFSVWRKKLDSQGMAVAINPGNPNTIYAQSSSGALCVSRNKGETWTALPAGVPWQIREILVHPYDTLTIFVVAFSGGLWKSTDGGTSWTVVISDFGIDGESVSYDPIHPDTMYAGDFNSAQVYRSIDRGTAWTLRGDAGSALCALAIRPDSVNILYAGTGNGTISKSTNSGQTWRQVKSGGSAEIPRIVINPLNPMIAYGTGFSGSPSFTGVWKTTDGGEHWFLTSLQFVSLWSLEIDQNNPDVVYAGSFDEYTAGVYRTTDAGNTWELLRRGFFRYNSMWNLKIDPDDVNNVYVGATIGSFGQYGLFRLINANAGIQGVVRDSLNNNPISNTSIALLQPNGDQITLDFTGGNYEFFRFDDDTNSTHEIEIYINGFLFKEQQITFIDDSLITQDILVAPGSIRGTVFNDLNSNGVRDNGEPGLPNWFIYLLQQSNASAFTDDSGNYVIDDLFPGTYDVNETRKYGWTQTYPALSHSVTITMSTKHHVAKDFGNHINHYVTSVSPTPYSNGNSRLSEITAVFDTAMDEGMFNDTVSWIVTGSQSGRHRGSFSFSSGNTVVTFTPDDSFQVGEVVTVNITGNLKTAAGSSVTPYEYHYTIETPPSHGIFSNKTDYTVGNGPWTLAVGDIDSDGDNDIVTVNQSSNTITVLMNNGYGTFPSSATYITGATPRSIVLADVDNDGDLDIAVANQGGTTVSVFTNNGNGTYAPKVDYSSGPFPSSLSASDMDGDGDVDLVSTTFSASTVSIIMNNGTGAFPTRTTYSSGTAPWSTATADLTNDGGIDVVVVNSLTNSTVSILVNTGGAVLSNQTSYSVGDNARSVVVTDIDDNDLPDFIVTNSNSNSISVYPNSGNGNFGPRADYTTESTPWGMASGDVNGDGFMDIVTANSGSNAVSVFTNLSGSTFSRADYPAGNSARSVALADLDQDGDLDIAVANSGTNTISILMNATALSTTSLDGWNMVSVPVNVRDYSKATVYPTAASPAFAYQAGYVARDTLEQGAGYWVKFDGVQTLNYFGNPLLLDTIDVNDKWNLVGSLTSAVDADAVSSIPLGIIATSFYAYDGSYQVVDSLRPGNAHWVKVSQAGEIILNAGSVQKPSKTRSEKVSLDDFNTLIIEDSTKHRQTLYFTGSVLSEKMLEHYELPPAPPSGLFDVRFYSQRFVEAVSSTDVKEFPLQLTGARYPIVIRWSVNKQQSHTWVLETGTTNKQLVGEGSITLQQNQVQYLKLKVLHGEPNIVPTEYVLAQNYPNPFNPSTEIRYGLPVTSHVKLTVVNILGQQVAELLDEEQGAGWHRFMWRPDISGGVYFLRMQATSSSEPSKTFVQMKKCVLLK
ncbi:MAG: VCBS repeat-containing protein [Ignavibacteriae bacterium]|nr:VCBS repeat-containing protein [Ignavibacteriota bacterium]